MSLTLNIINKLKTLSVMTVAIGFSIFIHVTLLAVKFEPELKKLAERLPSLDVVLVNAKTKNVPKKADLLAQVNLDRGGNTDADRKMKTALPAPKQRTTEVKLRPSAEASNKAQEKEMEEKKRVEELEKKTQRLLTQLNASKKLDTKTKQDVTSKDLKKSEKKTLNRADLIATSIEIDRLEAQIAKQQEEYQKRPKRRFIGARTKAVSDALYLEAWRQKVERIGNLNYPTAARDQKIYGQLRMTVSVRANGTVEKIEIDKSSGSKILDAAAVSIVRLAAPYAPFSAEMRKTTDILDIIRTWSFTQEDMLATQ